MAEDNVMQMHYGHLGIMIVLSFIAMQPVPDAPPQPGFAAHRWISRVVPYTSGCWYPEVCPHSYKQNKLLTVT